MYFDTHVHFDTLAASGELPAALARARAAGVTRMLAMGGTPKGNALALDLAAREPGVLASVGLDRELCADAWPEEFWAALAAAPAAAIGETGLDYYHQPSQVREQKDVFQRNLEVAAATRKPVIVHTRDAAADTLALLTEHARKWRGPADRIGVIHCFTGDADLAARVLDLGFHISFSGIVTFRNADTLRAVAAHVPDDRLLIETDTPYLAPVPLRGRSNEPAFVVHVGARLAEIRGQAPAALAALTTANARRLFAPAAP